MLFKNYNGWFLLLFYFFIIFIDLYYLFIHLFMHSFFLLLFYLIDSIVHFQFGNNLFGFNINAFFTAGVVFFIELRSFFYIQS